MTPDFRVTVGLITHNEIENIDYCLSEILSTQNLEFIYEVIIVDNASTDQTLEVLRHWERKYPSQIKVFPSQVNLVGQARQTIVDHCESEYLLFTDADCIVPKDWVFQYSKIVSQLPENCAGACGTSRLPEHHNWQMMLNEWSKYFVGHGGSPQALKPVTQVSVSHLPTTNALFIKSQLKKTKGFIASLMVGEDSEIGTQFKKIGLLMLQFPAPVVINNCAPNFRAWMKRMFRFGGARFSHSPLISILVLLLSPLLLIPAVLIFSGSTLLAIAQTARLRGVSFSLKMAGYGVISLISYVMGFIFFPISRRI
jgi:glycosyltransferase involved in cell wall biosynthesis